MLGFGYPHRDQPEGQEPRASRPHADTADVPTSGPSRAPPLRPPGGRPLAAGPWPEESSVRALVGEGGAVVAVSACASRLAARAAGAQRSAWGDESGLVGADHRLCAIAGVKLCEQVSDVGLDRLGADDEHCSAISAFERPWAISLLQHVGFAVGESCLVEAAGGGLGWCVACRQLADRGRKQQVSRRRREGLRRAPGPSRAAPRSQRARAHRARGSRVLRSASSPCRFGGAGEGYTGSKPSGAGRLSPSPPR